ncbi:hypothetical protein [Lelliottia amnigena]
MNVPGRLSRRRPGDPGSRQENHPFAVLSAFSASLWVGCDPASLQVAPSPRFLVSLSVAPAWRKRVDDLQPEQGIAVATGFMDRASLLLIEWL